MRKGARLAGCALAACWWHWPQATVTHLLWLVLYFSDLLLNSVAEDDAGNVVKMTDAQVGRHVAVGATRAKRVT